MARSRAAKAIDHIAGSKAGAWFFVHPAHRIDKVLMPLTKGRLRMSIGKPTLLLHTTGAKSGEPRTAPVLFLRDGDYIVVIASNGGNPKHPSWYHNLRAHPRCEATINGRRAAYTARRSEGTERARLWDLGISIYEGWNDYDARTSRNIPIMVLEPAP